jgi:O-antigen/teichoic acid export membrane protein
MRPRDPDVTSGRDAPDAIPVPPAPPDAASATTGATVVTAGLWATASRLLPQFFSLAISVVAARFLGPNGMGRQSLIAFAAIFATTAATLGVPSALMRYVGEQMGAARSVTLRPLIRVAWKIEGLAAACGAGVLIGIGLNGAEPRAAWLLAGITCALAVLQKVPVSVLVGLQHWRDASAVTMFMGGVAMIATILVLLLGGGVTDMIAVGTASTLVIFVWTTIRMRRRLAALTGEHRRDAVLHRRFWRYSAIASLGVPVTLIVWFRSEFFFLAHYASDKEIALYSIAFSAYTALVIIPQSLANAIAPAFATLYGAAAIDRIRQGFGRSMRLLLTATLPITAVAIALGPATLRLVYGDTYRGTGTPLTIMLVLLPFVALLHTSMSLLVGLGRQWLPLILGVLAAAANIGFDLVLIPRYEAVGAAAANAAGQIAAAVPIIVYAVRCAGGVRWETTALTRAALVSAACGLAAAGVLHLLGGGVGVAVGVVAWAVSFVLLARVLHIVSPADAAWLEAVAGARLGRISQRMFGRSAQSLRVPDAQDTHA